MTSGQNYLSQNHIEVIISLSFFLIFLETMDIETRSELLSLFSFRMIYMANNGVLEKHTYNLVGNNVKQDAILTWNCLSWLLLNKVICNFYLVSYLSF